mgnify:CR=1 FL=1
MLCAIKIWNLVNHMKKQNKNVKMLARSIDEKLKSKGLMFFVSFFSCDLRDFKFWYVNGKAFGTSFLYYLEVIWIFAPIQQEAKHDQKTAEQK